MSVQYKSFPGQANGRDEQIGPGELAKLLVSQGQAVHGARNADAAVRRAVFGVDEHAGGGGGGGGFAEIKHHRFFGPGGIDEHVAAAADVAGGGISYCQREGGGDRGIHGVAPLAEDLRSGVRSRAVDRDDYALRGCLSLGGLLAWPEVGLLCWKGRAGENGETSQEQGCEG